MEIFCKLHEGNTPTSITMMIFRKDEQHWVGEVSKYGKNEPELFMGYEENLTLTEIEHVLDNWENLTNVNYVGSLA